MHLAESEKGSCFTSVTTTTSFQWNGIGNKTIRETDTLANSCKIYT